MGLSTSRMRVSVRFGENSATTVNTPTVVSAVPQEKVTRRGGPARRPSGNRKGSTMTTKSQPNPRAADPIAAVNAAAALLGSP